jgi:hypothetical protein
MTGDDFDSIVHHAQVIERYEHPTMRPLSEENFRTYDRRELDRLRRATVQPAACPQCGYLLVIADLCNKCGWTRATDQQSVYYADAENRCKHGVWLGDHCYGCASDKSNE